MLPMHIRVHESSKEVAGVCFRFFVTVMSFLELFNLPSRKSLKFANHDVFDDIDLSFLSHPYTAFKNRMITFSQMKYMHSNEYRIFEMKVFQQISIFLLEFTVAHRRRFRRENQAF